ncbi:ribosome maturation factor RimP [Taylorella equigenitalis]|uniref:Ribosome maturation factor RimP n=3 Tax=Taylorella equigenitalis TaxID=29575 RepID=A0A654KF03_TAYEM|nr:ribosome maturation factor RimP [Taylorella equigenitalis]ADU90998.1 transcription termination protein NusA [Taylorella equigenitalis MCE9]AFN36104.1 ribosome maturation factor RimP [Taylorella equigenitalis ATCC 35865]ASY30740.1 ribosome maturation factor [Taylorella equigenitalis]ASY38039.1 ribosome maturation factor RimP [Taylorella equigenitalis]ASY39517.1 ribosome maturation factor [Taylorella equigenitalis]
MKDIFEISRGPIEGLGYELVDIERAAQGLLRVTIDIDRGITIEDCEEVSRLLSRIYEVEDVDYARLEVGSPGTDRPLKKEDDFHRFAGQRVEVKFHEAIASKKVFKGVLEVTQDINNPFRLVLDPEIKNSKSKKTKNVESAQEQSNQIIEFNYSDVDRAKLDPILNFKGKK